MKRFVLFLGGTGARAAEALMLAAAAGAFQAEEVSVLLADTDSSRATELLQAQYADYARVHEALGRKAGTEPFSTALTLQTWPENMPGEAAAMADWAAGEEDALLCQALFDYDTAHAPLSGSLQGRYILGRTLFAALLDEAAKNPADALTDMIAGMNEAIEAGQEVRVVLAGSLCGGAGAAGLPLLARHIRRETCGKARIGAVLLAATGEKQDAALAREALKEFAREEAVTAACVLGLPHSSCTSATADYARLTDWLAIYCMDILLHRPQWPEGLFTVQAPQGPLTWDVFGKAAPRYRLAYGRLIKVAAAWDAVLGPQVEKRLTRPALLRDGLFGWYAHFFRRARQHREENLTDVRCLSRLMRVALLWLGSVMHTLPPEMAHAEEMAQAIQAAQEHYRGLTELVGQLTLLDEVAQRTEVYEEGRVYRRYEEQDAESEKNTQRIDAVKREIAQRTARQEQLNRHMGGAAMMRMLQEALDDANRESEELRARYIEANRRIDHAEAIAAPEDLYRITDARTKLDRMVRHQQLLDARADFILADVEKASGQALRYARPALSGAAVGGLFHEGLTAKLCRAEKRLRPADVEGIWASLVTPADGRSLKEALKKIKKAEVNEAAPVMSLLRALLQSAMKEG